MRDSYFFWSKLTKYHAVAFLRRFTHFLNLSPWSFAEYIDLIKIFSLNETLRYHNDMNIDVLDPFFSCFDVLV